MEPPSLEVARDVQCVVCGKISPSSNNMRRISHNRQLQDLLKNYLHVRVQSGNSCRSCLLKLQTLHKKHVQMKSLCHSTVHSLRERDEEIDRPVAYGHRKNSPALQKDVPVSSVCTSQNLPKLTRSLPTSNLTLGKHKLLPRLKPKPPDSSAQKPLQCIVIPSPKAGTTLIVPPQTQTEDTCSKETHTQRVNAKVTGINSANLTVNNPPQPVIFSSPKCVEKPQPKTCIQTTTGSRLPAKASLFAIRMLRPGIPTTGQKKDTKRLDIDRNVSKYVKTDSQRRITVSLPKVTFNKTPSSEPAPKVRILESQLPSFSETQKQQRVHVDHSYTDGNQVTQQKPEPTMADDDCVPLKIEQDMEEPSIEEMIVTGETAKESGMGEIFLPADHVLSSSKEEKEVNDKTEAELKIEEKESVPVESVHCVELFKNVSNEFPSNSDSHSYDTSRAEETELVNTEATVVSYESGQNSTNFVQSINNTISNDVQAPLPVFILPPSAFTGIPTTSSQTQASSTEPIQLLAGAENNIVVPSNSSSIWGPKMVTSTREGLISPSSPSPRLTVSSASSVEHTSTVNPSCSVQEAGQSQSRGLTTTLIVPTTSSSTKPASKCVILQSPQTEANTVVINIPSLVNSNVSFDVDKSSRLNPHTKCSSNTSVHVTSSASSARPTSSTSSGCLSSTGIPATIPVRNPAVGATEGSNKIPLFSRSVDKFPSVEEKMMHVGRELHAFVHGRGREEGELSEQEVQLLSLAIRSGNVKVIADEVMCVPALWDALLLRLTANVHRQAIKGQRVHGEVSMLVRKDLKLADVKESEVVRDFAHHHSFLFHLVLAAMLQPSIMGTRWRQEELLKPLAAVYGVIMQANMPSKSLMQQVLTYRLHKVAGPSMTRRKGVLNFLAQYNLTVSYGTSLHILQLRPPGMQVQAPPPGGTTSGKATVSKLTATVSEVEEIPNTASEVKATEIVASEREGTLATVSEVEGTPMSELEGTTVTVSDLESMTVSEVVV